VRYSLGADAKEALADQAIGGHIGGVSSVTICEAVGNMNAL
jgi:hypothetical protein